MSSYKALALDFDGTIADNSHVTPPVVEALRDARARGLTLLLATGRILDELLAVFPDAEELFDAIVAENGAVLAIGSDVRDLGPPVSAALYDGLRARGIDARRGRVLVACHAIDDQAVLEDVRALGLEDQLVHNRGELMILPPGVTKGSGVQAALAMLGLHAHNLVAVGDAENDHALLTASQFAVAVENAVPSLKAHADLTLPDADGAGIVALLRGPILRGPSPTPQRHQIVIGADAHDAPVPLDPGRRLLITGGTHSGKSYIAGLIAERLIAADYVLLILDTEGDHARLDQLPTAVTLTGEQVLADPTSSTTMTGRRALSEVVDMASLSTPKQQDLVATVMPHVEAHRRRSGLPHLIMLDEAHLFFGDGAEHAGLLSADDGGCCLITYSPAALPIAVLRQIDLAIVLPFGPSHEPDQNLIAAASIAGVDVRSLAQCLDTRAPNRAVLLDRNRPGEMSDLCPGVRATPHVRHRHKYIERLVDPHHSFRFCEHDGDSSGPFARSLDELNRELRRCSPATLRHHGARHDFSRWAIDILGDGQLADALRPAEHLTTSPGQHIERGRAALLDAIESRYLR